MNLTKFNIVYSKCNNKTTIIDEDKARFVIRAFELYASGLSLEKVRIQLREEGFIYQSSSAMISKGHLAKMLQNVNYLGVLKFKINC